jgi:putative endonuclease
MFYAYVLKLASGQMYVGHTHDLKKRLAEHKRGGVDATKHRRPFELLFYASFNSIEKARDFEKYLKSPSGKAFRNKRLI